MFFTKTIQKCRKCSKNTATYYAELENKRDFPSCFDCTACQLKIRQPPLIEFCDSCELLKREWERKSRELFDILCKDYLYQSCPDSELFQFYACETCLPESYRKNFRYSEKGFTRYIK
jgi:hypothetical protein